jgi:hypothetical protein
MLNSTLTRVILGTICGVMLLVVLKYLFDTYSASSLLVAFISTLVVIATVGTTYLVQRRRCAIRASQQAASRPN